MCNEFRQQTGPFDAQFFTDIRYKSCLPADIINEIIKLY